MPVLFNKELQYLPLVEQAASKYGVPPSLILGHIKQESAFNPMARLDEPALGDASWGMMQLLLRTAQGLDPAATASKLLDPAYNIDLGTKYIAQNMARYPGDIQAAIAAYNAGSAKRNAQGQFVNSRGVPNVQNYVDKVYGYYIDYSKWLDNGASTVDLSVDPWLVAGFSFIFVLTIIGGGLYASRKRKRN